MPRPPCPQQTADSSPRSVPRAPRLCNDIIDLLAVCAADPRVFRADLGAVNAQLRPPATATGQRLRRTLSIESGPARLGSLVEQLGAQRTARLLPWLPALEPAARARSCTQPVWLPSAAEAPKADASSRLSIRQGRLGDCWLIAVLIACEAAAPGFVSGLVRPCASTAATDQQSDTAVPQLCSVELHVPRGSTHPLLLPVHPVTRRSVIISSLVPPTHRCGDERLRPNAASLVEKAIAVTCGGSYRALQFNFAGNALRILTGRHCPARPVPRTLEPIRRALAQARPVVASTLVRPRGSFRIDREDGRGQVAIMDGHVYAALGVARTDEDGQPDPTQPLRVQLRNPLGGPEGPARMTDLYLSARQLRRCFISVNIGPSLADAVSRPPTSAT